MSKIETLATHNRDYIWEASNGPIKVRDMTRSHLNAAIEAMTWNVRRNSAYPPTHSRRKHEGHRKFQILTMQCELEWRDRNGL